MQLDHQKQTSAKYFINKHIIYITKCIWKCHLLQNGGHFVQAAMLICSHFLTIKLLHFPVFTLTHWPSGNVAVILIVWLWNTSQWWIISSGPALQLNATATMLTDHWGLSCEMSQDLTDDKSVLIHVVAWCLLRSMTPFGVTRPQWVKDHGQIAQCNSRVPACFYKYDKKLLDCNNKYICNKHSTMSP